MTQAVVAVSRRQRAAPLSPDERRQQILQVAGKLIARSGFNGVSVADIAKECGVGKSLVFHYFPTMKELLYSVLQTHMVKDFVEISGGLPPSPTPAASRLFVTRHIESNLRHKEIIRLQRVLDAEALDKDHPAHALFADRYEKAFALTQSMLSWKDDPFQSAKELLSFWHGLEIEWLRDERLDVLKVWNSFADRFFAMSSIRCIDDALAAS